MRFRPCIDIHNGAVKQIVGGSLKDQGDQALENFRSDQDAAYYARMYREDDLPGGHVILLNSSSSPYYEKTKGAGAESASGISERAAGRRRNYGGECRRVFGGRSKSCHCYILCI